MSLSVALNNALSGLNINRESLAVLSQNIANANTKGYSRQIITQQSQYLDGRGMGASIIDVSRRVDDYLIRTIRSQNAAMGQAETVSNYFERTQILLGKPGSANSIDAYVRNLFNAAQSLSLTPESSSLRLSAVNSGVNLARNASALARSLQDLRYQADGDISQAIQAINKNILDLQQVNSTIGANSLQGKPVSDLLDKRDMLLTEVAKYIDIRTLPKANGTVDVYTTTGVSLLDSSAYQLRYTQAGASDTFISGGTLTPIEVFRLDPTGQLTGQPITLVSSGTSGNLTNILGSGTLKGLLEMRDVQIPNMLKQLDTMTASLRDQFNAVHNKGIAFPGTNSYTGTRAFNATDSTFWSGKVRFAVLDQNGKPVTSPYADEPAGMKPLTLDLSKLNSGNGDGYPSLQGIIDEFNQHYAAPGNKAKVGTLNNVRMAINSPQIPTSPPVLNFDFDLDNLSDKGSNFYVTNMEVFDDNGAALTPVTTNRPQVTLASTNTYVMNGTNTVTINTDPSQPNGLQNGDRIYLSTPPGTTINGVPVSELGGFIAVQNVTATSFQITVNTPATGSGGTSVASQTALPVYAKVPPGESKRTSDKGTFSATIDAVSDYFTVRASVAVDDGNGNITQSQVTYRVNNNQVQTRNQRVSAESLTGQGELITPRSGNPIARMIMVDANGNELPTTNGKYTTLQSGFLKIVASGATDNVAVDSLDSTELGRPNDTPPIAGTGRSFAHYFELNNFFKSNGLPGSDTTTNSALNLAVEQRLINNPNLISLGTLVRSPASGEAPIYTYERASGDNSIIQKLAQLGVDTFQFQPAGGLGQSRLTFGAYAAQIVGTASTAASSAESTMKNEQVLLDGFQKRSDSISGVNLDEELANTVIYQNAYSASARVITVANELFDTLINSISP